MQQQDNEAVGEVEQESVELEQDGGSNPVSGELVGAVDETRLRPYDAVQAGLAALRERASQVYDLSSKDGMREAKAFAKDLSKLRTRLESARRGAKAFLMGYVKMVGDRADVIKSEILAIEEPLRKKIADYEAEQERIRIEKENERRRREEAIRNAMEPLQRAVILVAGKDSPAIREKIQELSALPVPGFDDQNVVQAWLAARNDALKNLANQLAATEEQERHREEARRREERAERLQMRLSSFSGPVILASQANDEEVILAQLRAVDESLAAVKGEDPSFMASVQDACRASKAQIESILAAFRARRDEESRLAAQKAEMEAQIKALQEAREAFERERMAREEAVEAPAPASPVLPAATEAVVVEMPAAPSPASAPASSANALAGLDDNALLRRLSALLGNGLDGIHHDGQESSVLETLALSIREGDAVLVGRAILDLMRHDVDLERAA